jgi:hypothetical protein
MRTMLHVRMVSPAALTRQPRPDEGRGALRPEIAPVWEIVEAGIRQGETYAPSPDGGHLPRVMTSERGAPTMAW